MKQFLLFGAILSVAMIAYGIPSGQSFGEVTFPITNAQVQCGLKLANDLVHEHFELKEWGVAMGIITKSFAQSNQECASLPEDEQKDCYDELTAEAKRAYKELINFLPENLREQFKQKFFKCFQ
ncbi:uncharacterized protein LOC116348666 [Contarinia nasturtii]|uniref:uncharacterized protein LOC116348666 n=1 Tax=Contarinia nasturtii TaxID=265458 RepID=UPI0012D4697F|nr:uncharacterized protein LOC116348666 [Contarinia nasturtii]